MTENNAGHQSVLRWHIVDNVPFQKSFEGCIEKYYPNASGTLYACTACWYLAPGGVDPYRAGAGRRAATAITSCPRSPPADSRSSAAAGQRPDAGHAPATARASGATTTSSGGPAPSRATSSSWPCPSKKAGKYEVERQLTKARDYGIVQLSLDGKKAGEPIDLYNDGVIPTDPPVSLGTHDLTAGEHKLTVEIVGANAKAVKGYMFGLDYLIFEEAK